MAQWTEGQILNGSDGKRYRVVNGVPVSMPPTPFANPTLPLQLPTAQEDLRGKQLSNEKTAATLSAEERKANAEATAAELAAKQAQEQWNINHPQATGTATMSGPAYMHYLQQTNPGRAAYIQGLSEGRIPFPSAQMMRTPAGQALLTDVMRADPTIDATNYTTRAAERKNAAVGKLSNSDNALITSIGHAARLETLVPDVAGGPVRPLNWAENLIEGDLLNGKQPAYEQNAHLLGNELAGAYNANTEGKQNQAGLDFSSSLSTRQKQDNILGAVDLLSSKLAANRAQFAYGNGQLGKPDFMLLPPQTRQELLSIPGAAPIVGKYFSGIPQMGGNGGNSPPPSNGGGFTPPPTGPTNGGLRPSGDGFNETPDPQSAAFWAAAARNGTSYRDALKQWQSDVQARGLRGITPPPPDAYQKAADYISKNPNVPYQPFTSVTRTPTTPEEQAATGIGFSGPMVGIGHAVNAAAGSLPTMLAGDQGARYNAVSGALHPNWALGGDIAGSIAGAYGAGKAVDVIAPSLGAYGQIIGGNPARAAMTGDAAFFTGSGAAQHPDDPFTGGVLGMTSAMGGNALGRFVIGPAARAALDTAPVQGAINRVGGIFGRSFNPPAPLDPGANMIFSRKGLGKGLPDQIGQIRTNLQDASNLNLPYMMADANPQLRALAGSAARKSPDVMATAEGLLQPRQVGQGERAIGLINNHLAPVGDVPTMQADLLKQAQAKSGPLYDAAKAQPVPELTANPQLNEIFQRPAGQAAIRKGWETALNNGEDVGTLTYATDPNGQTVQYGNPSWNVIHYARQALDANGDTSVRQALDKQIATINPGFKAADAAYSGVMKGSDALQAGSDATGIRVTPEATQQALAGFPNHLPQFQQGYASNMADMIERQRLSGNPYNLVNGSAAQQAKLGTVFPNGAANFQRAQALEGDMGKTYQGVLGNSATATRTEADKQFDNLDIANDLIKGVATGGTSIPYDLAMTGARKLANANQVRMSMAKANALAPYLFNPDPNANLLMLNNIMAQQAARKAYLQNFGAVTGNLGAGMFGAPIVYGASNQ